jgi:LysR family glycine cleavage system transcriptional activator
MPFVIYSVASSVARKNDPMVPEFSDWLHAQVQADGISARRDVANALARPD